jgi:hypothetical protein
MTTSCDIDLIPAPPDTGINGIIAYGIGCLGNCPCEGDPIALSEIVLKATVSGVTLNDEDTIYSTSYDLNGDGSVDPIDFVAFAQCYSSTLYCPCADFNWDYDVNPIDFVMFAQHFMHHD